MESPSIFYAWPVTNPRAPHPRALLLLPAGLALLAGIDGALMLLGLPAPLALDRLEQVHGPLMVLCFVGTVIALERAVALRAPAGYLAPALLGLGGLVCLSTAPLRVGQALVLAGTLALIAVYARLWRRQAALPLVVEALGAASAAAAALLWLGGVAVPYLAPWLVGFLVLTVLGERIELGAVGARLVPGGAARAGLAPLAAVLGYLLAAVVALVLPDVGYRLLGLALLVAVALVLRVDVAVRTVRTHDVTRYMAVAMLAGYAWLVVAGATWLLLGSVWQGRGYDAVLHAVFLGFVISMILAHAPVILPAVVRRPLPYHPAMYAPLALLHVSLLVRVLVGDAWDVPLAVQVGGVGNIVAVLAFLVIAVTQVVRGAPSTTTRPAAVHPPSPEPSPTPVKESS